MPVSMEDFYLGSGRAGRDGLPAHSVVCYSQESVVDQWPYRMKQLSIHLSVNVVYRAEKLQHGQQGS